MLLTKSQEGGEDTDELHLNVVDGLVGEVRECV